jgi:predicted lysophospholipase L1 biosynthesis ABC-type transport system permease subunit
LALLLAAVGNYWVISYSVTQRVPEIAIRMALGADKKSVVSLFVVQELRLVCTGHSSRRIRRTDPHPNTRKPVAPALWD